MGKKEKKQKKSHGLRRFFISFLASLTVIAATALFLMYGPFSYFRDLWVTTAMSTFSHQWLASVFYDQKTIDDIMNKNRTIEPSGYTDPNTISIAERAVKDNATELPNSPEDGEHIIDGIGFIKLSGATYQGWLVKVYDPSRIYMGVAKNIGKHGEKTSAMVKRLGAYIGINAGGFADAGGEGSGGLPCGICIIDGKQISGCYSETYHNVTGIDYNNKLVLGKYTNKQVKTLRLKFAVEFHPFLILNGKPSVIRGNGGMGTQPRTVIGQTKTGVMLFAIIDGRRVDCVGASLKDLQEIMLKYGAINASNLDGGSSSTLVYKGNVVNRPSSRDGERYVPNAFLVNHSAKWKS